MFKTLSDYEKIFIGSNGGGNVHRRTSTNRSTPIKRLGKKPLPRTDWFGTPTFRT